MASNLLADSGSTGPESAAGPPHRSAGRRSLARWAGGLAAAAAAAYLVALGAANSPPARRALRSRVEAILHRALPGSRLEGPVSVDWRFRAVLGPVVAPGREPGAPPLARVAELRVTPRLSSLLRGRAEPEQVRFAGLVLRAAGLELGPLSGQAQPGDPLVLRARLEGGGAVALRLDRRGPGAFKLDASADGLVLRDERLSPEPVGPLHLALRGDLQVASAERGAALEHGLVELAAGAGAELEARLSPGDPPTAVVSLRAPRLDWPALLAALPEPLRPPAGAPALRGTLGLWLEASGPPGRLADWQVDAALDLTRLSPAGPVALARPFDHHTPAFTGSERTLHVGPQWPHFAALDDLPRHVVGAITLAEDAGFFGHHGFDLAEIREALAEQAAAGRARGASTITQQLAKNLWVGDERSLARKVREALATVALEASLPKRRILEIYLNVIEWGPGVHGLGEAAWHYFRKAPRDLTPKEAAFLASIIPNPARYHLYYERGGLTEAFEERVRTALGKMYAAELIGEQQFLDAVDEVLVFPRG